MWCAHLISHYPCLHSSPSPFLSPALPVLLLVQEELAGRAPGDCTMGDPQRLCPLPDGCAPEVAISSPQEVSQGSP